MKLWFKITSSNDDKLTEDRESTVIFFFFFFSISSLGKLIGLTLHDPKCGLWNFKEYMLPRINISVTIVV